MTLRVGVIGAGAMGRGHALTISGSVSGAEVAAISDADVARAERVADEVGGAQVQPDAHALIEDSGIDAVLVASSDETHEGFVLAGLAAGKPMLCEKPLATTAAAGLRIVDAEAALGRRLLDVGFMRRYDPGHVAVKRALDQGLIGDPVLMHCTHRNVAVPAFFTPEMIITSAAVHEIDVARWMLGEELVAATVHRRRVARRMEDALRYPQVVVLESESGVLVDVEVFVNARYGYEVRCELVGEEGTIELPGTGEPLVRTAGRRSIEVAPDFLARFATAYRDELQAWVHALAAGSPSGPSAWDGYAANAVADACLATLATGGTVPVELAPRPALYEGLALT